MALLFPMQVMYEVFWGLSIAPLQKKEPLETNGPYESVIFKKAVYGTFDTERLLKLLTN